MAITYETNIEIVRAVADYLNEGLRRGQLCVYATVRYRDDGHIEEFGSHITNFKENVENGNLLVVDLAPLYISALLGDLMPFEDARKLFVERAKDRADKHVRFVGDGTGFLFKNRHFDECAMVEEWWQEKPFEGSYLCPYEKKVFDSFHHEMHSKRAVFHAHDIIIDASEYLASKKVQNSKEKPRLPVSETTLQGYNSDEKRTPTGEI